MEYFNQSIDQVLKELKTNDKKGLTNSQVQSLRAEHGLNKLKEKKQTSPFVIFARQFKSFIIYILLFAVTISLIAREYIDSIVILIILTFNAFFGFIQEYRAEKAVAALKKLSALKTRVLRDSKIIQIDAQEVVPGDIIVLEEGDKIPADSRLIESINLSTGEASLTGESAPVTKSIDVLKGNRSVADQKNMVFSGTVVTRGRGKAVVVSTGMKTEIGKIAGLINETEEEPTPLQRKLESLGKWIGFGTIAISIIVFLVGIIKEEIYKFLLGGQFIQFILEAKSWFLTAVALAVAAVPEGLPAIVTIALALGVRRMVKRNALIRRLPSVETLGETTVICSDKTGTLTKNEMTVRKIYTNLKDAQIEGEGYDTSKKFRADKHQSMLFQIGVLCNNASLLKGANTITGDPTEAALLVSAEKTGLDYKKLKSSWKRIKEEPFDSNRKMMSTVNISPTKKQYVFTKGAPEAVVEKCTKVLINGKVKTLDKKIKKQILKKNDEFASQALRVLAFAYKPYSKSKIESNLIFVGLQGMIDPPRPEVKQAVEKCKLAGIRVVMVTGDNLHTAEAIARDVRIEGGSIKGVDFEALSEQEQLLTIKKTSIFARVEPQHKMKIVKLLQKQGHIVAMTGDGVNDAPALKKADMGIAMGIKGTDVSKEASDMILQDDNFASIVNSVEEGRGIYENIRKFVNYLLSSNLAEVLIIFLAILFSLPLPMTAIMLLWLNLVTDGLPALALSVDPAAKNIMQRPPKKAEDRIMNKSMVFNITYVGVLITIAVLALFYWGMSQYAFLPEAEHLMKIQTIAFTALIVMEFARLQAIRSEYKLGIFSNKYLILAVIASISLQLSVIYTPLNKFFGTVPLNLTDWVYIVGATIIVLILNLAGSKIKARIPYFKD